MTTNTPTPFDIIAWYAAQHNGNPPRGTKHIRELPDGYGAFIKENFAVMQVCLTTGRVLTMRGWMMLPVRWYPIWS